jgi:hypothetical protein
LSEKSFKQAIQNLNEIYSPVIPNLNPFTVHLSTYLNDKRLIVELRKKWTVDLKKPDDQNKLFLKKLLNISFSEKPIVAEIRISYKDSFRQKAKLKSQGIL